MSDATPRHPTDQTMAAFVDGRLAPGEIAAVASHLRDCAECRHVASETARFSREEEEEEAPRTKPLWWLAAAAAVIAGIVALLVFRRGADTPIAQLAAASPRDHRYLEARLSGFPWAPLTAHTRGGAHPNPADLKLAGAAGTVLETSEAHRDRESRHATGVAYLLVDRTDDGIVALAAATDGSRDARAWNDLAAARYQEAIEKSPAQLPEALSAVDRALALDPRLAEARFNRALILERLGMTDQARQAWQSYLDADPRSQWSAEARAHVRALQPAGRRFDRNLFDSAPAEELVRDFPEQTRRWSDTLLLASWADAEARHDSVRAAAIVARAHALGVALAKFNGERLLADAVDAIERSRGAERAALIDGHRRYDTARRAFAKHDLQSAANSFRDAAAAFERGGSAMAEEARYYEASVALSETRSGHETLTALLPRAIASHHRALAAEIHWTLAVDANRAADWGTAVREADLASDGFRALGERSQAAFTDSIAAYALEIIGDADAAALRRARALEALCGGNDRDRCNALVSDMATTLAAVQRPAAAAAMLELAIDSDLSGDPATVTNDLTKQARVLVRCGDASGAHRALANAMRVAARIGDSSLRAIASQQIAVEEASLRIATDPRGAITDLDRAEAFFASRHLDHALPYVDLLRARARHEAGDLDGATRDYASVLAATATEERSISDATLRFAFRDTAAEAVEESIELALSRRDADAAIAITDRCHALDNGDALTAGGRDAALIEYAVLPRRVAIFCRIAGRTSARTIAIDRGALAERVETLDDEIVRRAPEQAIERDAAELHRLLIAPVRAELTGVRELAIVPDRQLYAIPFAALFDAASRRFLIEDYTIRIVSAVAPRPATPGALAPAVVFADPTAPGMPPLRASREEAARIAALHGAALFAGDDATAAHFIDRARQSALIHYAGHANSDVVTSYAALLLADRVVGANEIAHIPLTGRPLVVLAACGTFRGNAAHVAGMSSLARAFLLAGARNVVATLWEIDDDVSAPLFLRFHESIRAGASPARALRDAQLAMLRSADARLRAPATWSPVIDIDNV